MKQILTIFFLLAIAGSCVTPNRMFAQNGDVLVVYATPNTLNAVINADTLADGTRRHHVYHLVSLDTTYLYDGPITSNEDISVIGIVHPSTGRPPCIQPMVLQDQSIPVNMFILSGAGTRCTFKNLYLLALATNNTAHPDGIAMQVSADNIDLIVDNCVFDGWQAFAIGYNGDWDSFFVTRSHFRNMVHPNQWYIGEVLRNEWPGEKYTDTVSFKYNTMMCINGYASAPVTKYYTRYFEFIGNKVVFTFKNPFFIFNVTNAKINDNLFYANYAGGVDQTEHPWWDNLFVPDSTYGVIAFEPLSEANKEMFVPGNPGIAEAMRTIEVKNNQYFWPTALTSFWTTYNSTATNKVRTPMWMNEPTIAMFADNATWPGLVESGNQDLDPGYGSAFDVVLNGTTGNDIGLLAWFTQVRTGTAASDVWGYQRTQVGAAVDWVPVWPVPELTILGTPVIPSDTLVVYATPNTLNAVINADTLANGTRKHHVYHLVSLDTTYLYDGPITSNEDISVIGIVHPSTGRPPCIQPMVLQDQSIPVNMFILSGAGTRCTFKNLYLLALATNNTAHPDGIAIQVSADNVRLTVDQCVFDGWQAFAIGYNGDWDSFFVTRSHFRNMVHPNQWYIGEVLRNEWPGEKYTDTVSFKYNTMMCINGYASAPVTKYYTRYFEFIGNKVVFTFKNPFFIFNVTNAKINDNLFYANYAGGVDQTEHPWWDNLFVPDSTYGVIAFEPLSEANKAMFAPGNVEMAEALRTIEVLNNTYFWPTALTSFWTTYNSTATNKVRTPMWMNEPTIAMFADNATWPGLVESGNQDLDPGYGSAFDVVLNGTTGNDIGLLAWFTQVRTGTAASDVWGYQRTQVGAAVDWVPVWPVPEVAVIGVTDVSPIDGAVPTAFQLYPVYPNPFNPSAKVRYTLDKSGITNLRVYNILGQSVTTVLDHVFQVADTYNLSIDMSGFTSGIYFCVLEQSGNRAVQKMMLVK